MFSLFCLSTGVQNVGETIPEEDCDIDQTTPQQDCNIGAGNITIGSCLLGFVIWHMLLLLCGIYVKCMRERMAFYWCLRICNCGCCCWVTQLTMYTTVIGRTLYNDTLSFPHTLVWFVVISVVLQYLIILYCIVELVIDGIIYILTF